jgi:transketolase
MGKGVKSIEDNNQWHGKVPSQEQLKEFLHELY